MREYCPETGKEAFASQSDARAALRAIAGRRGVNRRSGRPAGAVHLCSDCHRWHLMSTPYR